MDPAYTPPEGYTLVSTWFYWVVVAWIISEVAANLFKLWNIWRAARWARRAQALQGRALDVMDRMTKESLSRRDSEKPTRIVLEPHEPDREPTVRVDPDLRPPVRRDGAPGAGAIE